MSFHSLGAVQVSRDRSRGEGGVPQNITFDHQGGGGSRANDHLIMIMHKGGGGRSNNDHLITLLFLVLEEQKRLVYLYCHLFWAAIYFYMVIIIPFNNCPSRIFLHVVMMNQNCHFEC